MLSSEVGCSSAPVPVEVHGFRACWCLLLKLVDVPCCGYTHDCLLLAPSLSCPSRNCFTSLPKLLFPCVKAIVACASCFWIRISVLFASLWTQIHPVMAQQGFPRCLNGSLEGEMPYKDPKNSNLRTHSQG